MSRETSPLIVGDFWLDKRRDGKSPDVWQITTYSEKSRSNIYRSTKRRTVEDAGPILRAYEAAQRSKTPQDVSQAELLPHLFNYLREHGPDVKRLDTVKSSFRAWIGFLMQDELGTAATVADINKVSVARFRRWRMGEHSWEVEWNGKLYSHKSKGVSGEAVQRNIEDLRSALYHAESAGRIVAPKLPSVDKKQRSEPRNTVLTVKQLGAIMGYAKEDTGAYRWIALMVATAGRPDAALAFSPKDQWKGAVVDLQPPEWPITDKRNAIVPTIEPLKPILQAWKKEPHEAVKSRKRWWRTMRRALGLPANVVPKTIRHTVATWMDAQGVPGSELSSIAGHLPAHSRMTRTTARYVHYDPYNAPKSKRALTTLFEQVSRAADQWSADHLRTKPVRGKPISLELRTVDA